MVLVISLLFPLNSLLRLPLFLLCIHKLIAPIGSPLWRSKCSHTLWYLKPLKVCMAVNISCFSLLVYLVMVFFCADGIDFLLIHWYTIIFSYSYLCNCFLLCAAWLDVSFNKAKYTIGFVVLDAYVNWWIWVFCCWYAYWDHNYELLFAFSVLVHSGGVHGGHYYAYIRPTLSDQWYALCSA